MYKTNMTNQKQTAGEILIQFIADNEAIWKAEERLNEAKSNLARLASEYAAAYEKENPKENPKENVVKSPEPHPMTKVKVMRLRPYYNSPRNEL